MKTCSPEVIKKVRHDRKSLKISYRKLSNIYKIPAPTIRNWCKDIGILKNESLLAHHQLLRQGFKRAELSAVPMWKNLTVNQLKFLAALLYGCEGAKYPATRAVYFTNSDPKLILTFLKILRRSFYLDSTKITVRLQIHTTHTYSLVKKYWSGLLDIPEDRFLKPTITTPRKKKIHENYQGTCTFKYQDYSLQLKLLGLYEEFLTRTTQPQ